MKRPLLAPLAGLIAGIASCGLLSTTISFRLAAASLILAAVTIFHRRTHLHLVAVTIVFFCAGAISASSDISPRLPPYEISNFAGDAPIRVEGTVAERPETRGEMSKVILTAERVYRNGSYAPVTGRVLLTVRKGRPTVCTGDRVRVLTTLRMPESYGTPGEFDYRKFLAWRGIYATAPVREAEDLILMETRARHPLLWRMDQLCRSLVAFVRKAVPSEEGGVVAALVLGDRSGVSEKAEAAYSAAGVNHVLSISGFHMAVVALIIFQGLLFFARRIPYLALRFNLRRDLMLAALPVLVLYLLLVGPSHAAVRSVVMLGVCIIALSIERETDGLNTLILAAFTILAFQPGALFDLSFQLSFLALWGLLVLAPLFTQVFGEGAGFRKMVALQVAASLAAIVATFLPVLFHFHRASWSGILANFVVIPLVGYGAVVAGFLGVALTFVFPAAASWLFILAGFFVYLSDLAVTRLAKLPMLPAWQVTRIDLLVFFLLLVAITLLRGRQRIFIPAALFALLVSLPLLRQPNRSDKLRLTFFSLGQSESSLLRFPDGTTMLIDGGGSLFEGGTDVGERLLGPALRALGVTRIDRMVLTHPHPDHLKGLLHIATFFSVGEFWDGSASVRGKDHMQLQRILSEKGVPIKRPQQEMAALAIGAVGVQLIPPTCADGTEEDQGNESSIIVRVSHGENVFLFTGDIGFPREYELLRHKDLLKCDVLKVPHHGSRYSSSDDFLKACGAQIGLISAGRRNSFHLPAKDTLDRLRRHRMAVYRTDLDGTIDVESDGKTCRVTTFRDL